MKLNQRRSLELGLDGRIGARRRLHTSSIAPSLLCPVAIRLTYSYILSLSPVISPSHLPLLSIQYTLRNQTELTDNVTHKPSYNHHQRSSGESLGSLRLAAAALLDHQFTDRCSERESPTRPRSSPLGLDVQAWPDDASRLRLHPTHSHHHASSSTPRITLSHVR